MAAPSPIEITELPDLASELVGKTSPFQRELLADKVITTEEYVSAVTKAVSCLRDKGFTIEGPVPTGTGDLLTYDFIVPNMTNSKSEAINRAQDACAGHFLDEVEQLYLQQQTPRGERRRALQAELVQCVRATAHQSVAASAAPAELMEAIRNAGTPAAYACRTKYDLLFTDPL